MSSESIGMRVEALFAAELNGRCTAGTGVTFHRSRAGEEAVTPYGVVRCERVEETTSESAVYRAEVSVSVIHSIDENTGVEHETAVHTVEQAINRIPKPGRDEDNGVLLYGFVIKEHAPASDAQDYATVLFLEVGCGRLEVQPDGAKEPGLGDTEL